MIYLVGVDHLVQYNGPVPEHLRLEFKKFIIESSRTLGIDLLAEEFSREALEEVYYSTEATVLDAARILGIEHRFCDPEEHELHAMGIPYYAEAHAQVRKELEISNSFILDEKIRKRVELETAQKVRSYWHLREEFWFDRLMDVLGLNILFICGHEHVERFRDLLLRKGHLCEILDPFWGREMFIDYKNINLS